jgi:adenylosuccinate lyase
MSHSNSVIPNVLASRYATKEMVAIFDPVNKIIAERRFWITIQLQIVILNPMKR